MTTLDLHPTRTTSPAAARSQGERPPCDRGRDTPEGGGRGVPVVMPAAAAALALMGLRVLLAARLPGHGFDMWCFQDRGRLLARGDWLQFYDRARSGDHLPGDLVLHGLLASAWAGAGGVIPSWGYGVAIKMVAILGDLGVAAAGGALVARRHGPRAGWWTSVVLLGIPLPLLVSSWWGQWDSVSLALVLAGALLLDRSRRAPQAGGVALLAWATLIKPPLALVVLPLVLWRCVRGGPLRSLAGLVGCALVGASTVSLLGVFFGVGLVRVGTRWSVVDRLSSAAGEFDAGTLGAINVWMWLPSPSGSDAQLVLGVPARAWSLVGVGLWCLVSWGLGLRARGRLPGITLPLAVGASCLAGWHLLATRCHERYVFPAAVLAVVVAALDGRRVGWVAAAGLVAGGTVAVWLGLTEVMNGPGELALNRSLAILVLVASGAALAVLQPAPSRECLAGEVRA
ncbi:hypothetical protein [Arsenicicoccus dermatophilus]|uniref:hypothetical protein n=1 Tax=Arsenicicoccus dermatophilus TaxID=1076331 RepID=UPI0039170D62